MSGAQNKKRRAAAVGRPMVKVPVLSKTTADTCDPSSSGSAPLRTFGRIASHQKEDRKVAISNPKHMSHMYIIQIYVQQGSSNFGVVP